MGDEARFGTDLFQGTAEYYDRYRLAYPGAMLADLVARARVGGDGRLLDLACGTGQLALPLRRWFAEVWAVDQEPDMVRVLRATSGGAADAAGGGGAGSSLRTFVSSAEELAAPPESFELVVIGNAFHRLDRDPVARRIHGWLRPGGHLALCWSTSPWVGETDWQRALAAVLGRWKTELGAEQRIPANLEARRGSRPDLTVLSDAGFECVGRGEFTAEHHWSLPELAGHIRSTSFLPPSVLGPAAAAFDADLAESLRPYGKDDSCTETVSFAYDLVRKPPATPSGADPTRRPSPDPTS